MRFQGSESLPPHLDRRLQRRMMGYVGLIALAMFGILAWQISTGRHGSSLSEDVRSPDDMDFDVQSDPDSALKPDEVRILPRERRRDRDIEERDDAPDDARLADRHIPTRWLKGVEDNTVGIRKHESDAYYRILARAKSIPPNVLAEDADRNVLYVNLMTSPELYRGEPITIVGELGELFEFRIPENDYGLEKGYEAWIVTADSGNHPYRVVATSLSPKLIPGKSNRQTVQVTGYFFKCEGYETTERRLHVAPTLLAGRVSLYVSPRSPPPTGQMVPWVTGIVAALGLAMLATVIGFAMSDRRANRWRQELEETARIDAAALSRVDRRLSIEESLRRLARDEPLIDQSAEEGNGHAAVGTELPDEFVDLPTPFPPTRSPKPRDDSA